MLFILRFLRIQVDFTGCFEWLCTCTRLGCRRKELLRPRRHTGDLLPGCGKFPTPFLSKVTEIDKARHEIFLPANTGCNAFKNENFCFQVSFFDKVTICTYCLGPFSLGSARLDRLKLWKALNLTTKYFAPYQICRIWQSYKLSI